MRACVVVVSLLTACKLNPAFDDSSATSATTTSGPPPPATTTTGAPPDPTTAGTTTVGLADTGDTSTSTTLTTTTLTTTTTTTSGATESSTTGTTDATTGTTTGDATTESPAPGECPDDDTLVACYRFEDDLQTMEMLDGSAYGRHGTRAGTNAVDSVEGFAKAVELMGGSDVHVTHDPAFAPKQFTVSAFVFVKQGQIDKGLIDLAGSYRLFLADGIVKCRIHTSQDDVEVELDVDVERWYHFACSYDGATLRLHGHGDQFNPTPAQYALAAELGNKDNNEFIIGRVAGDDGTKYSGWMDQVMVFSRVLDADEVCDLAGPLCD